MVIPGHEAEVVEIPYRNPARPGVGLEVLGYGELARRLRPRVLAAPSRPDFHQFFHVTRGRGTALIDFVRHPVAPGTLLHLRPGQVQRFPLGPDGRPADLDGTLLLFTPAFAPRPAAVRVVLDDAFAPAAWSLEPPHREGIARAMAEIAAEYALLTGPADPEPRNPAEPALTVELLRQLLAALLLRVARLPRPPGSDPAAGGDVFRSFQRELERDFAATRNAHEYAARLGYSQKTLTRACRAATGRGPKELIDARVELEAKRLLAHTELPVAVIARGLGFSEPTNFGKFFTRRAGLTPGAFRERNAAAG
ncbi:AraC family transcriptional regulator [Phaeacidiphilus oryzae]|uniref:AraC family transcriptional regulator n=1 Tax=Phaeacidiphilus oryzae TaxID=348818 RepID=UPI00055C80B8|nr:helix-turn-helix transcriptional regulator [Phaeacidiphilus oryzae]